MDVSTIFTRQEEEINKLIGRISLRIFLKATPYASGHRTDLEKEMTPDFFYNHLYSHSEKAEEYISKLQERINRDLCKNVILYGYQGCGKTTFVHYMLRKLGCRNILINFDAYVDRGNEIKHELVSYLYRAIMCDVTGRDGRDGLYPVEGKSCVVSQKFCEVFNSGENKRTISENYDAWSTYGWLFDKLQYTMALYSSTSEQLGLSVEEYENKRTNYPEKDLKEHIAKLEIHQLMVVIVLWDIAYSLAFGKDEQCYIVFENLDTIYNASALPDFTKEMLVFRNNIDSILADLRYNGESLSKMHGRYILIFVMRETTKCEFVDHFVGKVEMYIPPQSMSFLYEMEDIVKKRNSYLYKLEQYLLGKKEDITQLKRLEQEMSAVQELLSDSYISGNMFGLFNRNFRVVAEILSEIAITAPDTFVDAEQIRHASPSGNWSIYASRCILFRQIFNRFAAEKYLDILKNSEHHIEVAHKTYSVNISRYILLYLNNKQGIMRENEAREEQMVSLKDLFSELLKVCDDEALIVDSLWNMYEMRKKQFWGHLITFDGMLTLDRDILKEQLDWVTSQQDKGKVFGRVRITTAGLIYLETLLPHFEYFAARHFSSDEKSLFGFSLENLLAVSPDRATYMLSYILSEVYKEFEECFYSLNQFYRHALQPNEEYSLHEFLNSAFAWRKISSESGYVVKMFHGERVIHSHIGYLDSLRFYCFSLVDNMEKHGYLDVKIDVTKALRSVLSIRGIRSYIPTISSLCRGNVESFEIHTNKEDKDAAGRVSVGKQKIVIRYKNERSHQEYIPLSEIVLFVKVIFNYTIVNSITKYIKMLKPRGTNDSIIASSENIYLVSCYLTCIRENIERNHYVDFNTSICRKTGAQIIHRQKKNKEIQHTTQLGQQVLEKKEDSRK